jgi:hypothetical protein
MIRHFWSKEVKIRQKKKAGIIALQGAVQMQRLGHQARANVTESKKGPEGGNSAAPTGFAGAVQAAAAKSGHDGAAAAKSGHDDYDPHEKSMVRFLMISTKGLSHLPAFTCSSVSCQTPLHL